MNEKICAVIVTYNRKELLGECLAALLKQTRSLDKILIVDNASTDGTLLFLQSGQFLAEKNVEYLNLETNMGGAGGFHQGIKVAHAAGFDWVWVMDDDSIPESDALCRLLAAHQRLKAVKSAKLLASKAVWLDHSLHPMNVPQVKSSDPDSVLLAAQHSAVSIRFATFVSLLIHRSVVDQYGLPISDYFIWSDDIEYTARILRKDFGVAVPDSVVVHKTAKKYTHMNDAGPRYYYHVRNNVWMLLRSCAWSNNEKLKASVRFLKDIITYLTSTRFSLISIKSVLLGLKDGFLTKPRS